MANPAYLPTDLEGKMARLTEECGEVLQIIGKIGRFGIENHHPIDPATPNHRLLIREIRDLVDAATNVYAEIADTYGDGD